MVSSLRRRSVLAESAPNFRRQCRLLSWVTRRPGSDSRTAWLWAPTEYSPNVSIELYVTLRLTANLNGKPILVQVCTEVGDVSRTSDRWEDER
jgi:hypothetical protein